MGEVLLDVGEWVVDVDEYLLEEGVSDCEV